MSALTGYNAQMCSNMCANPEAHTSCLYCTRLCVHLILTLLFFPPPLSVSLSGHLCVFPLRGNLPTPPPHPLPMLFTEMTPV